MTWEQALAEYVGSLLGAFGIGFAAGFLLYVFRRITEQV